jgi:hypothetical protein
MHHTHTQRERLQRTLVQVTVPNFDAARKLRTKQIWQYDTQQTEYLALFSANLENQTDGMVANKALLEKRINDFNTHVVDLLNQWTLLQRQQEQLRLSSAAASSLAPTPTATATTARSSNIPASAKATQATSAEQKEREIIAEALATMLYGKRVRIAK